LGLAKRMCTVRVRVGAWLRRRISAWRVMTACSGTPCEAWTACGPSTFRRPFWPHVAGRRAEYSMDAGSSRVESLGLPTRTPLSILLAVSSEGHRSRALRGQRDLQRTFSDPPTDMASDGTFAFFTAPRVDLVHCAPHRSFALLVQAASPSLGREARRPFPT